MLKSAHSIYLFVSPIIAVICIELRIRKMVLFCVVHQVDFLILYAVAITVLLAVIL